MNLQVDQSPWHAQELPGLLVVSKSVCHECWAAADGALSPVCSRGVRFGGLGFRVGRLVTGISEPTHLGMANGRCEKDRHEKAGFAGHW